MNLFKQEQKEEDYYESVRGSNFWSKNYIEYERKGDTNEKNFQLKNILIRLVHI